MDQERALPLPQQALAWLLLLPAAALLGLFTHYPTLSTVWHSFHTTPKGSRPARFVGMAQYEQMAADPVFWQAVWNNLLYAAATIPLSIALAIVMALWVNEAIRGRALVRLAYFTPTVLPMVAVANIWLFFYTPDYGLLDQVLKGIGLTGRNWLGDQDSALWCLIALTVWKESGFFMIFYLAALQQVPPELAEAATLDGASRWTFFRRVLFPLLMPTTLFVLINACINAFRLVDHVVAMTKGGPDNATTLLLFRIYEVAFAFWDTGAAAAMTVVLLAVLALVALGQYALMEKRVHYQ